MIDQSTNSSSRSVYTLALKSPFYYIKRDDIQSIIAYRNRAIYTKFQKIDSPLTYSKILEHKRAKEDIYLPVYTSNRANKILFIYSSKDSEIFLNTIKHLFSYLKISNYHIYSIDDEIQVHIELKEQRVQELEEYAREISEMLESKLDKSWDIYPNPLLPPQKNIYKLPDTKLY